MCISTSGYSSSFIVMICSTEKNRGIKFCQCFKTFLIQSFLFTRFFFLLFVRSVLLVKVKQNYRVGVGFGDVWADRDYILNKLRVQIAP